MNFPARSDCTLPLLLQVISDDLGMKLDQVDINMLGRAKKTTITKDETILLGGAGDKHALEERVEQLRQAIAQATSDYDRWVPGKPWAVTAAAPTTPL